MKLSNCGCWNNGLQSKFYPIAIAVIENETFERILRTLGKKCLSLNISFLQSDVIADCASSISLAVSKDFTLAKRVHYWAHIWRLIDSIMKSISIELKESIYNDIYFLQTLPSQSLFQQGLLLFRNKWIQMNHISSVRALLISFSNYMLIKTIIGTNLMLFFLRVRIPVSKDLI